MVSVFLKLLIFVQLSNVQQVSYAKMVFVLRILLKYVKLQDPHALSQDQLKKLVQLVTTLLLQHQTSVVLLLMDNKLDSHKNVMHVKILKSNIIGINHVIN